MRENGGCTPTPEWGSPPRPRDNFICDRRFDGGGGRVSPSGRPRSEVRPRPSISGRDLLGEERLGSRRSGVSKRARDRPPGDPGRAIAYEHRDVSFAEEGLRRSRSRLSQGDRDRSEIIARVSLAGIASHDEGRPGRRVVGLPQSPRTLARYGFPSLHDGHSPDAE